MSAIRLYLSALTVLFFLAVVMTNGIGVLEGIVMTCVPLLLILDMRDELTTVDLLEKQLATLTQRSPSTK